MSQAVLDVIKGRRCIREFANEPVSEKLVRGLLDAARYAPSAGNRQAWFFYVVKSQAVKAKLAKAALGQSFLKDAPINIVVCAEPDTSASRYGSRGAELYCLQDTAAAVQNILLSAHGFGLAACWVGAFDENAVKNALDMAQNRRPVAIIPVGYTGLETPPEAPARREIDSISKIVNDK
ncbi:MAG: nitroreductase family protein [Firmicutes bacterium]|nr:nitroreductase family protein [Bacillota bacterium]